jgi:DNA-binding MarR family transcriptional regulator
MDANRTRTIQMSTGRRRGQVSAEIEVMIAAARVFAGITAESLAQADEGISLPQLRVLVLASRSESLNATEVATALQIHLSTASRLCDRLVQAGLLDRRDRPEDRRQLQLTLTDDGRALLAKITEHRRKVFTRILRRLPTTESAALAQALGGFIEAAHEYDGGRSLVP